MQAAASLHYISPACIPTPRACLCTAHAAIAQPACAAAMGLATVDLLYLHNPAESQLGLVGRQEFMKVC